MGTADDNDVFVLVGVYLFHSSLIDVLLEEIVTQEHGVFPVGQEREPLFIEQWV